MKCSKCGRPLLVAAATLLTPRGELVCPQCFTGPRRPGLVTLRSYRFTHPERDGQYLYGLILDDETVLTLRNIGAGRRRIDRWVRITQAQLIRDYRQGLVQYIDISPRCLSHMIESSHRLLWLVKACRPDLLP